MPTERKIRWAANFFIFSALFVVVANVFPIFDSWSRLHPTAPYSSSAENLGALVGFIVGGLVYNGWFYILVLVNGLVLRRYKSRIAAGLFILLGLWGLLGVGLSLFLLGFNSTAVAGLVFFGLYLLVAAWAFVTLMRLHRA